MLWLLESRFATHRQQRCNWAESSEVQEKIEADAVLRNTEKDRGRIREGTPRRARILVLDASPTSRTILVTMLRREGYQVVGFADPVEALRFLRRCGLADLLFLSLALPRMDGLSVLKHMRGDQYLQAIVPIALLEEGEGILMRILARLAGARDVVVKPLVRQQIVVLVSAYLHQAADPAKEK